MQRKTLKTVLPARCTTVYRMAIGRIPARMLIGIHSNWLQNAQPAVI